MSDIEFNVEELKAEVAKILITSHDFTMEDASDVIEEFYNDDPEQWHANVIPTQMAETLANLDDDE